MDRTRNGKRDRMRASWRRLKEEARKSGRAGDARAAKLDGRVLEGYDAPREVLRGYSVGREIVIR